MVIKSLNIISFGMLKDKKIELCDGLNVVLGKNETGKSTIGAFIKFIFYGLDKAEREKYIGWGAVGCSGSLLLEAEGNEYRIERELYNGRSKDRITVISGSGEILNTEKAPWEIFIGVPENVFLNTAFTADIGSAVGGQGLPEAIENIVFSADEAVSTKKALKRIDDGRIALLYKNKKGGRIHELENLVSELEVRLAAAKSASEHIFTLDDSIRTRKARMSKNKEKADLITKQLEDYETYRRINELAEFEKNGKALDVCQKELSELEKKYAVNGFLPDRAFSEELHAYEASAAELKELSLNAERKTAAAYKEMKNSGSNNILRLAAGIGGVKALHDMYDGIDTKIFGYKKLAAVFFIFAFACAAVTGVLLYFKIPIPYSLLPLIPFLLFLILGITNAARASKLKKGLYKLAAKLGADDPADIPSLLESVAEAEEISAEKTEAYNKALASEKEVEEKTDALDKKIRALTNKYKAVGINGLSALITEVDGVLSELSYAHRQVEMAQYKARISSERVSGESDEQLKAKLHGALKEEDIPSYKCDERRTELNLLLRQNEAIAEKVSSEEQSFAAANATFTLPSAVFTKLNTARDELEEAREDYDAYTLAYEKLNEASAALRSSISPTLAADAGQLMSEITEGKYSSLGISNKLEITYNGGGMTHSADTLSSGTQDAAYVSLRLALVKMLFPNGTAAFFDDTFARTDDTRAEHIIKALCDYRRQTVVFTCHEREGRFAEKYGGKVIRV